MFYSPNKNFSRFSTYRTAQINALRQRVKKDKVTPEEILQTQSRLDKLKQHYELLQQEGYTELKELLESSKQAIVTLGKQKASMDSECRSRTQVMEELQVRKTQLKKQKTEIEECLKTVAKQNRELEEQKKANQEKIEQKQAFYQGLCQQLARQRQEKQKCEERTKKITEKIDVLSTQQAEMLKKKKYLQDLIAKQKQDIAQMKKQCELQQKQQEKIAKQITYKHVIKELYQTQNRSLQSEIKTMQDNTELFRIQKQIQSQNLLTLEGLNLEQTCIQKEEQQCQKKIKEVLAKMTIQEQTKLKLEQKTALARTNLDLFKQKNQTLKTKLDSIFRSDCQLIKNIADKKFYPNCRSQILQILKNSSLPELVFKENQNVPAPPKKGKPQMLQTHVFSELNRVL